MATRRPEFAIPVAEFAAALLARPEVARRSQIIAEQVARLLPGGPVVVYVIEDQENPTWQPKAMAGDITSARGVESDCGTLGTVFETHQFVQFDASQLPREDYAHLDIRRTVNSLAYMPLLVGKVLLGAIELISFEEAFEEEVHEALDETAQLAAPALAAALSYESERNTNLHSISRVTQMYDLEKVFNSTLEMDELLGTVAKKFQEVMNVQGVNLWMVNNDALELVSYEGYDPTVKLGAVQRAGEGIAGDISDSGEVVLVDDAGDERLQKRNAGIEDGMIFSILAAPLLEHENLVGVVEAINRFDGLPFDEDDQFLLINICETASNALHNASLLQAERKVEILEALVRISGEITSTLDLDRVLEAIVNGPATVIPYERAAIALEQRGALQLKAVSGVTEFNPRDPQIAALEPILQWASLLREPTLICQRGEMISADREETRAKFERYFSETGMRAFHALPLADEEGRVGVLSFESSDPDFLTVAHLEMIKVLASQATV